MGFRDEELASRAGVETLEREVARLREENDSLRAADERERPPAERSGDPGPQARTEALAGTRVTSPTTNDASVGTVVSRGASTTTSSPRDAQRANDVAGEAASTASRARANERERLIAGG